MFGEAKGHAKGEPPNASSQPYSPRAYLLSHRPQTLSDPDSRMTYDALAGFSAESVRGQCWLRMRLGRWPGRWREAASMELDARCTDLPYNIQHTILAPR